MHMLDQCPSWLCLFSYLHACTVHVLPVHAKARPKVNFEPHLKSTVMLHLLLHTNAASPKSNALLP